MKKITCLIWVLIFIAAPIMVFAQNEADRLEKRFEKPLLPKSILGDEIKIPEVRDKALPKEAEKKLFTLAGVMVEGATVFTDADCLPLYEEFLGKTVSLVDVYAIAEAITAKYRNAGYILSRAFIPPQTIQNGLVRIVVVEGFVDEVIFEGEIKGRQGLLDAYARKITASRPLHSKDLERYLLLADDLPGVTVKSVFKPSDQIGASVLTIIFEHKLLDGNLSFDNRGTENVGPYQSVIGVGLNSVFNLYEKTDFLFAGTTGIKELKYYRLSYTETLNSEGLTLNLTGSLSQSEPGGTLKDLDVESESLALALQVSYPIICLREKNLSAYFGFTYRNSQTDILGSKFSEDRLRVANAGLSFDLADRWRGVSLLNLEVSKGLNIFDETGTSSANLTRADGHSDFTKVTANLSRTQYLPKNFALLASATGQWTEDPLLSSEEFGVGGSDFGRAYDPSEITGDRGFAGLLELRKTVEVNKPWLKNLQPFIYGTSEKHQLLTH